jgi:hypothetical protein
MTPLLFVVKLRSAAIEVVSAMKDVHYALFFQDMVRVVSCYAPKGIIFLLTEICSYIWLMCNRLTS